MLGANGCDLFRVLNSALRCHLRRAFGERSGDRLSAAVLDFRKDDPFQPESPGRIQRSTITARDQRRNPPSSTFGSHFGQSIRVLCIACDTLRHFHLRSPRHLQTRSPLPQHRTHSATVRVRE